MNKKYLATYITIFCLIPICVAARSLDGPEECLNVEGREQEEKCAEKVLHGANDQLEKYLKASKIARQDEPIVVKAIEDAHRNWLKFRKATCTAWGETWGAGTGRSLATYACEIDLTREWTHLIWEYFDTEIKGKGRLPEPMQRSK